MNQYKVSGTAWWTVEVVAKDEDDATAKAFAMLGLDDHGEANPEVEVELTEEDVDDEDDEE
jgi:hypothetical protein